MKTLLRIQWLDLKRDRIALLFLIVLPIAFFSIFASIFGSMDFGGGGDGEQSRPIKVIVIDEDQTELSRRFVAAMKAEPGFDVTLEKPRAEGAEAAAHAPPEMYTRDEAAQLVRKSEFAAAIVLPSGFGDTFASFTGEQVPALVIYDSTNPFAKMGVPGILQGVSMRAAPDVLMERGMSSLDQWGGGLTEAQRTAIDRIRPYLRGERPWEELENGPEAEDGAAPEGEPNEEASGDGGMMNGMIAIEAIDARLVGRAESDGTNERNPSMIPYYAAGIGVMFLLFSMAGAAGSLLKEHETGALDRVLTSNISMTQLLAGKWMFFALCGFAQVMLMFIWGELVFGRQMDLFTPHHMTGLIIMAAFTAMAAAAFGILIASLCRTRGQLDGMSTVVILIMSALGGSMVPRFVMPDFMKTVGLFTFNGQALEGFLSVFWESNPGDSIATLLRDLGPQLFIMAVMTVILFALARYFARRWEQA